jgi:hypothetical protein
MSDTYSDLTVLRGLIPRPRPHPPAAGADAGAAPAVFTAALARLQQWLETQRIPFVIVGSLACAAWTGQDSLARFSRPAAFGRTQRYPDIDVLVPRTALASVMRYSRTARGGPFPVAVDVSGAACFIDLRPDFEVSYLTHRQLQFPVPTALFTPRPARVAGTQITTIDPRVLLHTFGAIGGIIRHKDVAKVAALTGALDAGVAVSMFSEQDCAVFTEFTAERDRRYPRYRIFVQLVDDVLEAAPPGAASSIRHFVMPTAKTTAAKMNRTRGRAGASVR